MKNIEEQLNILQKTVMCHEEKGIIRGAVVSYMQENPLKTIAVRNSEDSRLHYRTANINNSLITKIRMTIAIIIALLLGGGTSFAAENALPGDVLYPIKIHVNENVQELVAVSDEAEAKLQAKLAENRLEEAEKLASEGRLDAEISADLGTRFEGHSQKSKEHREKVKKDDGSSEEGASISSDIEVSLGMHEKLLEDIEDANPEMKIHIEGILHGLKRHLKEVGDDRLDIEEKVFAGEGSDAPGAADGALNAAQNKIDEVKKFVETRKGTLDANAQAQVGVHLKAADAAVAEGKAKIEAKAYADAFALFKKAAREAQTAKLFATNAGELKIEHKNHNETSVTGTEKEKHEENNDTESEDAKVEGHSETNLELNAEEDARITDFPPGVSGTSNTNVHLGL